jgi:WD40 repeat protein
MCLDRDEVARRDMGVHGGFQGALVVTVVEVPDPGTGGRGRTVLLVGTERGSILAFDGESESCDYLGAVGGQEHGAVRRLMPYHVEVDGARRLRVVASGAGAASLGVWDFTKAEAGGRLEGSLVHRLRAGDTPVSVGACALYHTGDTEDTGGAPRPRFVGGDAASGHVWCWDPEDGRVVFELAAGAGGTGVVSITPYQSSVSGSTRLLTAGSNGALTIWETAGDSGGLIMALKGGALCEEEVEEGEELNLRCACVFWSPDARDRIASGSSAGVVRVFDGETVSQEACLPRGAQGPTSD